MRICRANEDVHVGEAAARTGLHCERATSRLHIKHKHTLASNSDKWISCTAAQQQQQTYYIIHIERAKGTCCLSVRVRWPFALRSVHTSQV